MTDGFDTLLWGMAAALFPPKKYFFFGLSLECFLVTGPLQYKEIVFMLAKIVNPTAFQYWTLYTMNIPILWFDFGIFLCPASSFALLPIIDGINIQADPTSC